MHRSKIRHDSGNNQPKYVASSLVFLGKTGDIANIINLSLSSIETGRSRLRKKPGLDTGDSLTGFLMKF